MSMDPISMLFEILHPPKLQINLIPVSDFDPGTSHHSLLGSAHSHGGAIAATRTFVRNQDKRYRAIHKKRRYH